MVAPNRTIIKRLAIVTLQGVNMYTVGQQYNLLVLDRIEDESTQLPDGSIDRKLIGYTGDGRKIFEAVNVPMDVQYGLGPTE